MFAKVAVLLVLISVCHQALTASTPLSENNEKDFSKDEIGVWGVPVIPKILEYCVFLMRNVVAEIAAFIGHLATFRLDALKAVNGLKDCQSKDGTEFYDCAKAVGSNFTAAFKQNVGFVFDAVKQVVLNTVKMPTCLFVKPNNPFLSNF